ncbi:aminomethyl-transferring glycine dehydrogenase subunit GcvPB [Desulfofalx alkaliphila]|uniref:aminomethyl-transferring glycine dehydrogenase subunit GcvPB n=1 Tax=Desulfofalx alkaliphila TaxID=105483 RepID=UPI0004E26439|nr:aminomethyl-transferring glycine dehydrogenase subunit GcvPB [Desulfofalx alkaliphila]
MTEPLIFEKSRPGRQGIAMPDSDVPHQPVEQLLPANMLRRQAPGLPQVSELDTVRHYTRLSRKNFGVDVGFYPLGSCTMKYNPKICEDAANLPGFTQLHPYQPVETVQGALELLYHTQNYLAEVTGMDAISLQPAAGAHGELTGLLIIKAYLEHKGEKRNKVIVPDSAHGTNPATATLAGFKVVTVKSDRRGNVDVDELRSLVDEQTAALMLTNPNTLGLFEENILEISEIVHKAGALLYYDGANMNAIMGITRPGDMGFDVVHLNLHKTFATPHGGGGPGSGPVGVSAQLEPFLPKPVVVKEDNGYRLDYNRPLSIGRVRSFYCSFAVIVKAYTYMLSQGGRGLKSVSEHAVLNANYLMHRLAPHLNMPFERHCMHEFVCQPKKGLKEKGVRTLDLAKRMVDYGYHPPTVYFPLIIDEVMMMEPTETESKETLDDFADSVIKILQEAEEEPELVKTAPHNTGIGRLDEVRAARRPVLRYKANDSK